MITRSLLKFKKGLNGVCGKKGVGKSCVDDVVKAGRGKDPEGCF